MSMMRNSRNILVSRSLHPTMLLTILAQLIDNAFVMHMCLVGRLRYRSRGETCGKVVYSALMELCTSSRDTCQLN